MGGHGRGTRGMPRGIKDDGVSLPGTIHTEPQWCVGSRDPPGQHAQQKGPALTSEHPGLTRSKRGPPMPEGGRAGQGAPQGRG